MKSNKPIVIEIARVHKDLPAEKLAEIAENYNPANHEAPITLGHPKDHSPSWGWVKKIMKIREKLFGEIEPVPEFARWWKEGRYKKRSIAYYNDPEKGACLRHVGFLGGTPPRIKGMPDYVFQESNKDFITCEFSETEDKFSTSTEQKTEQKKEQEDRNMPKDTYSEEQHTSIVDALIQKKEQELTKTFSEEKSALEEKVEELKKENGKLEEKVTKFAEEVTRVDSEAFINNLIHERKLAPKAKKETLELFMEAPKSVREKLKKVYTGREEILEFGEDDSLNDDEEKAKNKKKEVKDTSIFNNSKEDVEKYADADSFSLVSVSYTHLRAHET